MSKNLSRRGFIKTAAAGIASVATMGVLTACSDNSTATSASTPEEKGIYTPGTYSATATGMGEIKVTMTFDANSITDVQLDLSNETESIGQAKREDLKNAILAKQSADIDAIGGVTVTSDAVKTAAAACIAQAKGESVEIPMPDATPAAEDRVKGYSGPGDWLGEAPSITPDEVKDVEMVIVGMGHAGAQAVLSAMQAGAKDVVVLEKQGADIFDWYGEDIGAYNTKLAKEHGIKEYDLGEITNEYVTRSGGRCNPDIIRSFVQNSGPMVDNMLDVAKEVLKDKERYASLDGIKGTVLENNVKALEEIMLVYDNTENGQLFIQTQIDADKVMAGKNVYDCENLTNYPITCGTKTWATTVTFAGKYNAEPIQGVAANSTIRYVQSACVAKAVDMGATVHFDASAQVLVQNDKGEVTGVIANVGGKNIQYNTSKGVILAGGGYAANKDMCWALLNEYMEENERGGGEKDSFYSFMGGRDGSSIKMGCWAGGYIDPAPRGTMILGGGVSSPWGANSCLWLNAKGKRFCNEGNLMSANRAAYLQQSGTAVMLVDANWVYSVAGSGMEHGGPDFGRPQFFADMKEGMDSEPDKNGQISILTGTIMERGRSTMYKANTLDELLTLCGYDEATKKVALESIERYNAFCHAGVDGDYGKGKVALQPIEKAPFFASVGTVGASAPTPSMVTMSGLMTDEDYQVLGMAVTESSGGSAGAGGPGGGGEGGAPDGEGGGGAGGPGGGPGGGSSKSVSFQPIKGLYAVGNAMGGRYGLGYSTPSAGNSIGMACTNGYVAAKIVAEL